MILADTSAWVEYDRATGSTTDRRISELIATEEPIAVTEPVIMEVLAGARSECPFTGPGGSVCQVVMGTGSQGWQARAARMASMARMPCPRALIR